MVDIAYSTHSVADVRPKPAFAELSLVRARCDLREGKANVPKGATGTIVLVRETLKAYEVEFESPHVVIGVAEHEIELA